MDKLAFKWKTTLMQGSDASLNKNSTNRHSRRLSCSMRSGGQEMVTFWGFQNGPTFVLCKWNTNSMMTSIAWVLRFRRTVKSRLRSHLISTTARTLITDKICQSDGFPKKTLNDGKATNKWTYCILARAKCSVTQILLARNLLGMLSEVSLKPDRIHMR